MKLTQYLLGTCLILALPVIHAMPEKSDPAYGGYFHLAAMDKKCKDDNPSRKAALNAYRDLFLARFKPILSQYPESQTVEARKLIAETEQNGLPLSEEKNWEDFFAGFTGKDFENMCRDLEGLIKQRLKLENTMFGSRPVPNKPLHTDPQAGQ